MIRTEDTAAHPNNLTSRLPHNLLQVSKSAIDKQKTFLTIELQK